MLELSLFITEFLKYISIPLVAAIVGWGTNWLALKLTFWPVDYKGIWPIGWQGIVPRKAKKMAEVTVDASVDKVGSLVDIVENIGPDVIADHVVDFIDQRLEEFVDEIMLDEFAPFWRNAPDMVKQMVYSTVRDRLPYTIEDAIFEGVENLDDIINFKEMVIEVLVANPEVINKMFQEAGKRELDFIVQSGWWFGGGFGVIQLLIWFFYPAAWVLPVFGFAVGFATNWLAINLIFRPLHPIKIGPYVLQGLFLKRQKEVSETYSGILADDVITPRNVGHFMLYGSRAAAMEKLTTEQIELSFQDSPIPVDLIETMLGKGSLRRLSKAMARQFIRRSVEPFQDDEFNNANRDDVQRMIATKMMELTPEEFQNVLRPAFQEDEWLLILVGAGLGLLVGCVQWFIVFGGVVPLN